MSCFTIDLMILFRSHCFNSYMLKKHRVMETIFTLKLEKIASIPVRCYGFFTSIKNNSSVVMNSSSLGQLILLNLFSAHRACLFKYLPGQPWLPCV